MVDMVYCPTDLLFFNILFLYYYINLRSLINFCLFPEDIYLSLVISLSCSIFSVSFVTSPKLFYGEALETFVILSAVLSQVKSPAGSAVFRTTLFEADLIASLVDFLTGLRSYCLHLCIYCLSFYLYFYRYFCSYF